MNSIILVGRAGRDPEARYLETGNCVANLSLAVNGRTRDDETLWFNLEIWGKQAQVAVDYVRKGSLIGVSGSLKEDKWTDRTTGEEKRKWVVNVQNLQLLGPKPEAAAAVKATATAKAGGRFDDMDPSDEIPF